MQNTTDMNDIQDILSKTLSGILDDFQVTTTATPGPKPTYKSKKTAKTKKAKTQAAPANTPQKAANSPKIAPNPIDEDEFDLRKAVIYTEILTPKFKNEEF